MIRIGKSVPAVVLGAGVITMSLVACVGAQTTREEARAIRQLCQADFQRLCKGVSPGGGRIVACLEANAAQLSPACAGAMPRAAALREKAQAAGKLPQ